MQFNDSIFDELGRSAGVEKLCVDVAEKVASTARATAPVDSGNYREDIDVKVKHQKRVVALVIARDWKSMLIESKTGNLARALKSVTKRG